jgi:hypothetical protein
VVAVSLKANANPTALSDELGSLSFAGTQARRGAKVARFANSDVECAASLAVGPHVPVFQAGTTDAVWARDSRNVTSYPLGDLQVFREHEMCVSEGTADLAFVALFECAETGFTSVGADRWSDEVNAERIDLAFELGLCEKLIALCFTCRCVNMAKVWRILKEERRSNVLLTFVRSELSSRSRRRG